MGISNFSAPQMETTREQMPFFWKSGGAESAMKMIISLVNQKGGVGKTTTTASLGGALASKGYRVLVVDLDAQRNLSLALGVNSAPKHETILEVLFSWVSLNAVTWKTRQENLLLVPSHEDVRVAERFLPIRTDYEMILRKIVNREKAYDFILFDCPPSLGAVTLNALLACDLVIMPVVPELFALDGMFNVLRFHKQLLQQEKCTADVRILINMLDNRLGIHRTIVPRLKNEFESQLLKSVIQVDTRLRESALSGVPINLYAPTSRAALQFRDLALELLCYEKEKTRELVC